MTTPTPRNPDMVVVAIDPSTAITGIAILGFDEKGVPVRHASAHFDAEAAYKTDLAARRQQWKIDHPNLRFPADNADTARARRMELTRHWMAAWLIAQNRDYYCIDAVAYEQCNMRGAGATAAINQAIGAFLTLTAFRNVEKWKVSATTAKTVLGNGAALFRPAGTTAADLGEKERMVCWMNVSFGTTADPADLGAQAEADACAVGVAGWRLQHKKAAGAAKPKTRKKGQANEAKV